MAGRRSVWSDSRVIAAAARFVAAADETWRLQGDSDPECRFFQRMVAGRELDHTTGSKQGVYVCSPAGEMLARINSRDPEKVLATIEAGWAAWEALPAERREPSEDALPTPLHRWEWSYPERGLVLELVKRDLPPTGEAGTARTVSWNRDHAWFSAEEARLFVPESPEVGARRDVPHALVERLARFHFVDNVRGQTLPYAPTEVRGSLQTEVIARRGALVRLSVTGSTEGRADGEWLLGENLWKPRRGEFPRGIDAGVRGWATFDLDAQRFIAFDLFAHAERWGRTTMNGRRKEVEKSAIGIVVRLGRDDTAGRVPPAFIDVYDAPWIQRPTGD